MRSRVNPTAGRYSRAGIGAALFSKHFGSGSDCRASWTGFARRLARFRRPRVVRGQRRQRRRQRQRGSESRTGVASRRVVNLLVNQQWLLKRCAVFSDMCTQIIHQQSAQQSAAQANNQISRPSFLTVFQVELPVPRRTVRLLFKRRPAPPTSYTTLGPTRNHSQMRRRRRG